MSWYSLVKAMPLPRAKYPKETDTDHGFSITKRFLDRSMPEDYQEDPEGELNYLGSGASGMVYDHPTDLNKTIKYTDDPSEMHIAQKLLVWQKENGRFHPAIIGVYEVEAINDKVSRLVLEKVEPAQSGRKSNFSYSADYIYKSLSESGFGYNDWHAGNIGRRSNGEIVILDLGGLRSR
jgi:hypothetical protein